MQISDERLRALRESCFQFNGTTYPEHREEMLSIMDELLAARACLAEIAEWANESIDFNPPPRTYLDCLRTAIDQKHVRKLLARMIRR